MGGPQVLIRPDTGRLQLGASTTWALVHVAYGLEAVAQMPGIPAAAYDYESDYLLGSLNLNAAWTFHPRWTLELGVPVRYLNATSGWLDRGGAPADPSGLYKAKRVGMGEASVATRARLFVSDANAVLVDARVGVWLPTGSSDDSPFAGSLETAERHQIFGNGTIDPMGSLDVYYLAAPWRAAFGVWARLPLVANEHGQIGSTLLGVNVSLDRQLHTPKLRAMVGLGGQLAYPAAWPGPRAPSDYRGMLLGRVALYWLPSTTWQWTFGVDVPWIVSPVEGEFSMPAMLRVGVAHQIALP